MVNRFYECRNCIKTALVDIESTLSLEDWEVELLAEIKIVLEPIKAAVEALCRRDANLITADRRDNHFYTKIFKRTEQSTVLATI